MTLTTGDIVPTSTTSHHIGKLTVIHEIHDGSQQFRHRIRIEKWVGEWQTYEYFADINYGGRQFRACMDLWQPLFPEAFEIVTK